MARLLGYQAPSPMSRSVDDTYVDILWDDESVSL